MRSCITHIGSIIILDVALVLGKDLKHRVGAQAIEVTTLDSYRGNMRMP